MVRRAPQGLWLGLFLLPVGCSDGADVSLGELDALATPCAESVGEDRASLLSEVVGFGRGATGGRDGCVYHVTDLGDSGPGTLREAASSAEPLWIVFDRSGDISLESDVPIASNKTIDGRSQAITIRKYGLALAGTSANIVLENLQFAGGSSGSTNDAVHLVDGAHDIWVDHCSMSDYGDGLLDITRGATDVTVSWTHFSEQHLVMLIGAEDDTNDSQVRVTLHHNYWDHTGNYTPRLRFGRVHLFNNRIERWTDGATSVSMGGEIASENNRFIAGDNVKALRTVAGTDAQPGRARSSGDSLVNGATIEVADADLVFTPSGEYAYTLDTADESLDTAVADGAGAR